MEALFREGGAYGVSHEHRLLLGAGAMFSTGMAVLYTIFVCSGCYFRG